MKNNMLPTTVLFRLAFGIGILISLVACKEQADPETVKAAIIQADEKFSDYSETHGMNAAFYEFSAEEAVVLVDNSHPILGRENLRDIFSGPDDNLKLTWKPKFADISASGDLGYTYGYYEMTVTDSLRNSSVQHGTYVTIWKKDAEGKWKFVLDAGTEGLGSEK